MEAVFAEGVNVRDEVLSDGEITGTIEETFSGSAEPVVALEDFLDRVVVYTQQNP